MLPEPGDQRPGLRVVLRAGPLGPVSHLTDQGQFLVGRLGEQEGGGIDGLAGRLVVFVVVGVVLVDPVEVALEDAEVRRASRGLPGGPTEGCLVLVERRQERSGAGEEPLLEGLEHEVGRHRLGVVPGPLRAEPGILLQGGVDRLLLVGIRDLQGLQRPFREPGGAVPARR